MGLLSLKRKLILAFCPNNKNGIDQLYIESKVIKLWTIFQNDAYKSLSVFSSFEESQFAFTIFEI
jgi:hypothetical protein